MFRFLPSIPVPYKIRLHHGCPFFFYPTIFIIRLLCFLCFFQFTPIFSACGFNCLSLYFWNPTRSWAVHASDQWNQCFEKPNTPYFLWRFRFTNLRQDAFLFFSIAKKDMSKRYYVSSRSLKNWKYDRSRTTYRLDGDILCTNNSRQNFFQELKNMDK